MNYTLREWQTLQKPLEELIVQASSMECDDGWMIFPIGMSHGFSHVKHIYEYCQVGSHEQLVHCGITDSTDQMRRGPRPITRKRILQTLAQNGIQNKLVSESDYFLSLPSYKFVISPEGNGIDCHRHYEALMAGCIPIIEYNEEIAKKYKGCPILFTRDYSEITPSYLEDLYELMLDTTFDFSPLFLSSYTEDIQERIKACGNFWMERLGKGRWYS